MGKYAGMTTLERLAAAGLLADFEKAIALGARKAAMDMLIGVELTEAQAKVVLEGAEQLRQRLGFKG
jgi:hypothetical protein